MNVPAVAKKSFDELQDQSEYRELFEFILGSIQKIEDPLLKALLIHKAVDEFNKEVFSHPLVKELSPCQKGCTACCYTQVSVTDAEATLLAKRIEEGAVYDNERLKKQALAGNSSEDYYNISYQDRKCIFLNSQGSCTVYEDRPSVCRTNAVLGNASQCDTKDYIRPTRLVKTSKADMVIYASFVESKETGTLPYLVAKKIKI